MSTESHSLPDLNNTIQLPEETITNFRKNGHTLTRHLLSPEEAAQYRQVIVAAADTYNTEKRKLADRDTYGKAFLQIMNLWRNDVQVRKFVLAKRMAKVATDLLGVKNVRLYHDQALFKEAGGGHTPWHQDQYYWPIDTTNTVTMWMPLVDINVEMGMLTFASKSQHDGLVFNTEISDESESVFTKYVSDKGYEISRAEEMKAGDATWHYGYTIHNAPGNNSETRREVMTIIYLADEAKVTEPKNKWQVADREKWLMNKPVGSLIDSELNPQLL